jgi:hypothetical protein
MSLPPAVPPTPRKDSYQTTAVERAAVNFGVPVSCNSTEHDGLGHLLEGGGYLLFMDIGNNRRMKYTPGHDVTVKESTSHAGGLTHDLQGRLVGCERTRDGLHARSSAVPR